jgi:hypothetical protein
VSGHSRKPLAQKLGIKPGFRIFVGGAPSAYREIVGELPDGASIASRLTAPLDMVHLFATKAAGLKGKLEGFRAAIAPDGMVWVSWPKPKFGLTSRATD